MLVFQGDDTDLMPELKQFKSVAAIDFMALFCLIHADKS